MPDNPWQVENIQTFVFLNCPECEFKTKKKNCFQEHAVKSHPSSVVLFKNLSEKDPLKLESKTKYERLNTENFELGDFQNEETLEDIMFPDLPEDTDMKLNQNPKVKSKRKKYYKYIKDKTLISQFGGREVFHLCTFCKHSFKNIADLKIHIKRHQNVLPMAMIGRVPLGFEF